jgi:hypothetical protein
MVHRVNQAVSRSFVLAHETIEIGLHLQRRKLLRDAVAHS